MCKYIFQHNIDLLYFVHFHLLANDISLNNIYENFMTSFRDSSGENCISDFLIGS